MRLNLVRQAYVIKGQMKWGRGMKQKWINCLVVLGAIITGVLYCIYLQYNNIDFFKMIYKGILTSYEQKISGEIVLKLFLDYIKKIFIIFVLGSFSILAPLGFCIMFIIVFSYSFTISCFIFIYGIKGAIASFLLYGIQSMIIVVSGFYLLNSGGKSWKNKIKIMYVLGVILMGICIVTGLDLMGILQFHVIKQMLL